MLNMRPTTSATDKRLSDAEIAIILSATADLAHAFRQYAREAATALNNTADRITADYEAHMEKLLEEIQYRADYDRQLHQPIRTDQPPHD